MYSVKEIFFTIQGEGCNAGKYAVFCRFSGCNLWNGREQDRKKSICTFCDTDFIGTSGVNGGKFKNLEKLVKIGVIDLRKLTKIDENLQKLMKIIQNL